MEFLLDDWIGACRISQILMAHLGPSSISSLTLVILSVVLQRRLFLGTSRRGLTLLACSDRPGYSAILLLELRFGGCRSCIGLIVLNPEPIKVRDRFANHWPPSQGLLVAGQIIVMQLPKRPVDTFIPRFRVAQAFLQQRPETTELSPDRLINLSQLRLRSLNYTDKTFQAQYINPNLSRLQFM